VADGVEAQAGDLHEGVFGVRVDGDPHAGAGVAPALGGARVERFRDQPGAVEGEADRARAVVAVGVEGGVAAAPDVGPADDRVGGVDHLLPGFGGGGGRGGGAGEEDRGRAAVADPGVGEELAAAGPGDLGAVAAGRGGRHFGGV